MRCYVYTEKYLSMLVQIAYRYAGNRLIYYRNPLHFSLGGSA